MKMVPTRIVAREHRFVAATQRRHEGCFIEVAKSLAKRRVLGSIGLMMSIKSR
jgi:hypothetical protein